MPRPQLSPVTRLRHQLWAHMLMWEYARRPKLQKEFRKQEPTWADLGQSLLKRNRATKGFIPPGRRFQCLEGVARLGNDPRKAMLRVDVTELPKALSKRARRATRRPSGRRDDEDSKARIYAEFTLDLVKLGNALIPGSGIWLDALFWELGTPNAQSVPELRAGILAMMQSLDLVAPSVPELREFAPREIHQTVASRSRDRQARHYAKSLRRLYDHPNVTEMSLLAALVADSHATGDDELAQIHFAAFQQAADNMYLQFEFPDTLRHDFECVVVRSLYELAWTQQMTTHAPSIDRPYMTMAEWRELTGKPRWMHLPMGYFKQPETKQRLSRRWTEFES